MIEELLGLSREHVRRENIRLQMIKDSEHQMLEMVPIMSKLAESLEEKKPQVDVFKRLLGALKAGGDLSPELASMLDPGNPPPFEQMAAMLRDFKGFTEKAVSTTNELLKLPIDVASIGEPGAAPSEIEPKEQQ